MINEELEGIKKKIEETRLRLNELVNKEKHSIIDPKVIETSQLLDCLIMDYMNKSMGKTN